MFYTLESLSQAERLTNALAVLELSDEIDHQYAQLRAYNETGKMPDPPKVSLPDVKKGRDISKLDKAGLILTLMNVRTYLSRYERRMKNAKSGQSYAENEKKYTEYVTLRNEIEERIKNYE